MWRCRAPQARLRGFHFTISARSRSAHVTIWRSPANTIPFSSTAYRSCSTASATRRSGFILLIDTLYDHHVRLVASAEAPPAALYAGKTGAEAFEFERTASRLIEMQGKEWLDAWAARHTEHRAAAAG